MQGPDSMPRGRGMGLMKAIMQADNAPCGNNIDVPPPTPGAPAGRIDRDFFARAVAARHHLDRLVPPPPLPLQNRVRFVSVAACTAGLRAPGADRRSHAQHPTPMAPMHTTLPVRPVMPVRPIMPVQSMVPVRPMIPVTSNGFVPCPMLGSASSHGPATLSAMIPVASWAAGQAAPSVAEHADAPREQPGAAGRPSQDAEAGARARVPKRKRSTLAPSLEHARTLAVHAAELVETLELCWADNQSLRHANANLMKQVKFLHAQKKTLANRNSMLIRQLADRQDAFAARGPMIPEVATTASRSDLSARVARLQQATQAFRGAPEGGSRSPE